jgi:hypothetical protein
MDVFPVLAFQRVGKDKDDCKENQHDHAQLLANSPTGSPMYLR